MNLSQTDVDVYEFVRRYTETHQYPPDNVAHIARGLERNEGNIYRSVQKLVSLGVLGREPRRWAPVTVEAPLHLYLEE